MRKESTPCVVSTPAGRAIALDIIAMAIHEMGDEHSQSLPEIGERELLNFLLENIICRFKIPKKIAYDNRPQFIGTKVTKFLEYMKIKRITSSPYHPSTNGQAESTNKVIIQNLKKRLEASKGKWPKSYRECYVNTG
uniref:Integrase catalytic domain-containing protein n=1 Tax=Nicotiana tabacum TaxID=4097 RepID=A0A1S3ZTS6_TOBAC|nr:PREDICTED: uncharacterized protein LOC107790405 [Nicotiana tabacum]